MATPKEVYYTNDVLVTLCDSYTRMFFGSFFIVACWQRNSSSSDNSIQTGIVEPSTFIIVHTGIFLFQILQALINFKL
jgi:hypothetical protein